MSDTMTSALDFQFPADTHGVLSEDRPGGEAVGFVFTLSEPMGAFKANVDYWSWASGPAWPDAFRMRTTDDKPPGGLSWEASPAVRFNADDLRPFPPLPMHPGDRFYAVFLHEDVDPEGEELGQGRQAAWLLRRANGDQQWFGADPETLDLDGFLLLGGPRSLLRFQRLPGPPPPGGVTYLTAEPLPPRLSAPLP